ncbi:tetratricopeptide repeat protein [Candidatus Methylocalor cossyra]|uniref:TPR_REGION domain-containing protein n=1 Tax=Candidatus Methylocalor cossyra TaxID=3108543 RepID=A0ABM9NGV3_9GAMM
MQTTLLLVFFLQIGCAIHAIRRGYPLFWVFLIVFVPVLGCLLYLVLVLLPEFSESRVARRGSRFLRQAIDPGKELRKRQAALEISDTVANRVALAQEYLKQGQPDAAIPLYESALTGLYRTDPELLLGLATALAAAGEFARVRDTLDTLRAAHPTYDNPTADLLYARALEGLGEIEPALSRYAAVLQVAPGPEAKCRYALLLKGLGRVAEARGLFEEIVKDARRGGRHGYRLNKEWVDLARRELG